MPASVQPPRRSPPLTWAVALVGLLAACAPEEQDAAGEVTLPEETGTGPVSDTGLLLPDTGGGLDDVEPAHWLTMEQTGTWSLSPHAGPYTAMTGELRVIELLDSDEEFPACEVVFALTGEALERNCDGCDVTFAVSFYVTEGDPKDCRDPDLPQHDATRSMGWASSDRLIYLNYDYTGVWIPWFLAEETDDDELALTWEATIAVTIEEEEEE